MNYFDQLKREPGGDAPSRRHRPAKRIVQDIAPPEGRMPLLREPPQAVVPPRRPASPELRRGQSATRDAEPPPDALEPSAPEPRLPVRTWEPVTARKSRIRRRLAWTLGAAAAASAVIAPTAVFPRFSVIITPRMETADVPIAEFLADTALAAPAGDRRLPAIEVTLAKSLTREYQASGTKSFRERARGSVAVYNAYSSSPQPLVANTRLQDPSGKIFRLTRAVTVPGATVSAGKIAPTSIRVEVVADAPGAASNIGPAEFRIPGFRGTPKYQGFYAKSEAALSGGFEGEARVIERTDLERASEELSRTAIEELRQELLAKVPADPDFLSPDGARELAVARIDHPQAGERRDRFGLTVNVSGRLFAIRRSHLNEMLGSIVLKPGRDTLNVRIAPAQPDLAVRAVGLRREAGQMQIAVSGKLAYWHEAEPGAVAAVLLASTPEKAEAYLRGREEIASFRIKRFPRWLWFIPGRPGGLEIAFEPPA